MGRLLALEGDWLAVPGTATVERIPQGHCWVEGPSEISGVVRFCAAQLVTCVLKYGIYIIMIDIIYTNLHNILLPTVVLAPFTYIL